MLIESCPCCGNRLLRHARSTGAYLRCTSCWLEIPNLLETLGTGELQAPNSKQKHHGVSLSPRAISVV